MDFSNLPDAIRKRLPVYLSHREGDLALMNKFFVGMDFDNIANLAHKIQGSGTGYGFPQISRLAEKLKIAENKYSH